MNCPECQNPTKVADTRLVSGVRHRKRRCKCGKVTVTKEVIIDTWEYVDPRVKHPGTGRSSKLHMKKMSEIQFHKRMQRVLTDQNTPDWVKEIYRKIQ